MFAAAVTSALERELLPDWVIRRGIRALLRRRLREEARTPEAQADHLYHLIAEMDAAPVALHTLDANRQHYEVPTEFFAHILGKRMKYSSGYWRSGATLDRSEEDMLALTCERAELEDGQKVLDLGCGWGSFCLYAAERYPRSHIIAVSNSRTQKLYIEDQARLRGFSHLSVITQDMNEFTPSQTFDRIVSVEMFEHMRNHRLLLRKLANALAPSGTLFMHIFTHRELTYFFEVRDESDWMAKYFFTGGMMPGASLPFHLQDALRLERHWQVAGTHYQATLEAWLNGMDAQRDQLWPIFVRTYGDEAQRWWVYWRVFFMASAELFGFDGGRGAGSEWLVSHYRFRKP